MDVSIIIVNYNTISLTLKCLEALESCLNVSKNISKHEIIVVDNGSNDRSVQLLNEKFGKRIRLLGLQKNLGFAAANNLAMREASGNNILLLNSDAYLQDRALDALMEALEKDRKTGVTGGKLLNEDRSLQYSAGFFPTLPKIFLWMSFLDDLPVLKNRIHAYHTENPRFYRSLQYPDWVSGACYLFKKEVLAKAGMMDEKIFMYGEELEWCYRIKNAGYRICYTPEAEIIHSKGKSSEGAETAGISEEISSIVYFYRKHYPDLLHMTAVRILLLFGLLLRMVVFGIIGKHRKRVSIYAKAIFMVGR